MPNEALTATPAVAGVTGPQLGRATAASWPSPCGSCNMVWTSVPQLTTAVCGAPATERAARAERGPLRMGNLEQVVLDRAARLRAAEQGLQRLGARILGAEIGLARTRR